MPHQDLGAGQPFFLTVTRTNDRACHLDVLLWFVLRLGRAARIDADPAEFTRVRWFDLDEQHDWPAGTYDEEMGRFVDKLKPSWRIIVPDRRAAGGEHFPAVQGLRDR